MSCELNQELFGIYFDLPENDIRKKNVDAHNETCEACAEEFAFWEESNGLIRTAQEEPEEPPMASPIAGSVMSRIYASESWRLPVNDRIYAIPYKLRRNLTAVIIACVALFICSFVYTLTGGSKTVSAGPEGSIFGFQQAASASAFAEKEPLNVHSMSQGAVASLSGNVIAPIKLGPIHTYPDYLLVLSLLGLVCTLLIMNWFTRTRS